MFPIDSGKVVNPLLLKSSLCSEERFPIDSGKVDNSLFSKFSVWSEDRLPIESYWKKKSDSDLL